MKNFILTFILSLFTSSLIAQSCNSLVVTPTTTNTCYDFTSVSNGVGSGGGWSSPCAGSGFGGGGKLRVVQICTDATSQCINVNLSGLPGAAGGTSISLYTSCSGSGNSISLTGLVAGSTNCYADANTAGWSTAGLSLSPNTCYYMRIWTKGTVLAGSQICFKKQSPLNDFRCNPSPIGITPIMYDNYCMTAGSVGDPIPSQFCAGSLENNAWFSFTTSTSCTYPCTVVVTISGISCSGGGSGFQIGYFTGACNSLSNLGCTSGSGGIVTATINNLSPGQVITIGIDGNAGAYCIFDISATNVIALPIELISFSGRNINNSNLLEWSTASEINNDYFLLERSEDGYNWDEISRIGGAGNSTQILHYKYNDLSYNDLVNYYRLSQVDFDGQSETFKVISINNSIEPLEVIKMVNMMGQEVDEYQKGFLIYYYSDGTYKKIIK